MRLRDINTDKINRRTMDYLTALHIYFEGHKIHKQNTFNDYYLDGEGEGRFSKRLQYTLGVNPLTKEPGGLFRPLVIGFTGLVAGTDFSINVRPPGKEVWLVDRITGKHEEVASEDIFMRINDITGVHFPGASGIIPITDDTGLPIPANCECTMYPTWHDKVDKHDHILGVGPLQLRNDSFLQVRNVSALTSGKNFTLRVLYRRVK